tara:strand:+ start:128 stop:310 length:183 start_codon:yes stop_codon:yes gene_type:complete
VVAVAAKAVLEVLAETAVLVDKVDKVDIKGLDRTDTTYNIHTTQHKHVMGNMLVGLPTGL